ncbi:MAG: hypothetical protein HY288_04245 [Planctomycetia bacterium]|nr:hypothetical protein [Planctomycetia bacterium]
MAPKLSDEQRDAVETQGGRPVQIVDPATLATFYLISEEQFNQVRSLLEAEAFDIRETYAAQDQALRPIWDDPALDIYNEPDTPSTTL